MTIRVAINHNTHYDFDRLTGLSPHTIRLRPAPHCRTPIQSYSLKIEPKEHFLNWQQDVFGNFLASVVFPKKTKRLSVEVEVIVDMVVINPFDFFLDESAEYYPFKYTDTLKKDLALYLEKDECGPRFQEFLSTISLEKKLTNDWLVAVNQLVQKEINYSVRMEPGVQTPEETLTKKLGSCRDSGWLLVQVLRHLGLASRFASGYLVQLTSDEKVIDGPSGPEADFTDLHAWCEVFLPGAGWVGMDPTSGLFAGEGHIPLACTPRPSSAAPIDGFTDKCEVEFSYTNEVSRIHEDPRVTKPYTESQWQQVLTLGDAVDKEFEKEDVRLTMGGEPTFVSVDDMESAQWNTDALGKDKLALAKTLLMRLRDHFAPNGLLHYGQGKWYPGEEVPRWALGLFWRKDNLPIWQNTQLLARVDTNYGHDVATAQTFAKKLIGLMGIDEKFLNPAFEDGFHYLLEEQKIPINIDIMASKAQDSLERRRLARLIEHKFDNPVGFVVPVEWDNIKQGWLTSKWKFRRERLILSPGDSPLGLRLPLDELPQESEHDVIKERDPFEARQSLKNPADLEFPFATREAGDSSKDNSKDGSKDSSKAQNSDQEGIDSVKVMKPVIRTALCIEPRDGKIHIFMPPLYALENYIDLIAALELCAEETSTPIVIEGYEPPKDSRLQKLLVTPDPGVIEVNVHPTDNWKEQVENTMALYEAAKKSKLSGEKFMLDGRHTGTGGGNHITLGGKTPADSPMLRRPDLLRSFVTFWQHHPSLSYIFSGTFVGPTSQAPRADEGRDEMLYEMETAFQQMPDGLSDQPWLVDRLMRNLLIDITGNTHRAEFCIDKLYSPNSSTGRLGILEFRGFEMPPHARMALVQALLIRTLLARFWKEPYKKPLVRWGTALHDKFMLPHYLWQDLQAVVSDLQEHGYPFELDWLLPFQEFRFPTYGRLSIDDMQLELRWAIEPWHVLGEEVGSFGTARYVDSSVERLQIKIDGMTEGRYILACNGRRVPLRKTNRHGEFVGGVRYRAWAPPSALHPTIGVHTPLTFDIIDTWNGRSIGGCTYHVSHPGGRHYDTFPINAFEAESRRINRFDLLNHTPKSITPKVDINAQRGFYANKTPAKVMTPPPEESPDEYPHTLDLRRTPNWVG